MISKKQLRKKISNNNILKKRATPRLYYIFTWVQPVLDFNTFLKFRLSDFVRVSSIYPLSVLTHYVRALRPQIRCNFLATLQQQAAKNKKSAFYKSGWNSIISYKKKIPWMRFERMTYRLEGGCSIQLSYQGLDPEEFSRRLVSVGYLYSFLIVFILA